MSSEHVRKVCSLYRRSLKLSLDWQVQRHIWRCTAMAIRELFNEHRHERDPTKVDRLLRATEYLLWKKRHPEPYIRRLLVVSCRTMNHDYQKRFAKTALERESWRLTEIPIMIIGALLPSSCKVFRYCPKQGIHKPRASIGRFMPPLSDVEQQEAKSKRFEAFCNTPISPRCTRHLHCLGWAPVALMIGLLGYSYYVFIVVLCSNTYINGNPPLIVKGALYISFYHILLAPFLMAYLQVAIFRSPGSPKDLAINPNLATRYCHACETAKPERTHHCSACQRCILRMDHHCVWLNACVGHKNYKLFLLLLLYGGIFAIFLVATLLQEMIYEIVVNKLTGNTAQFLVVTVLAYLLGMSALALLVYHIFLLTHNMTTIEHIERQEERDVYKRQCRHKRNLHEPIPEWVERPNPYDLGGWMKNARQVLGKELWRWPIPWPYIPHEGIQFPRKPPEMEISA